MDKDMCHDTETDTDTDVNTAMEKDMGTDVVVSCVYMWTALQSSCVETDEGR
jgi:hypothetical protein